MKISYRLFQQSHVMISWDVTPHLLGDLRDLSSGGCRHVSDKSDRTNFRV